MGAFSFDIKTNTELKDMNDEFILICKEFDTLPNRTVINDITLSSSLFFDFLNNFDTKFTTFAVISKESTNNKFIVKINGETSPVFITFSENIKNETVNNVDDSEIELEDGIISDIILYYSEFVAGGIYENILSFIINIEEIDAIIDDGGISADNKNKSIFTLLYDTTNGFSLLETDIIINDVDIDINYGKGLFDKTVKIADNINETTKGVYIFAGQCGCGKTSYIRQLINRISEDKMVIYVPNIMFKFIEDPAFILYISQFDNIVFVFEDAESLICSSSPIKSDSIYTLLSLSDGLLNDTISVQLIFTISSNTKNIDNAFLRSGRLSFIHNFSKISKDDCNIISNNNGINRNFEKDMLLCDVYDDICYNSGIRIGFEN